jgi:hypothetical protein
LLVQLAIDVGKSRNDIVVAAIGITDRAWVALPMILNAPLQLFVGPDWKCF